MSGGTLEAAGDMVRALAAPLPGERAKQSLTRAAGLLGISERLAKSLVYRDWGSVSPMTAQAILANEKAVLRAQLARAEEDRLAAERRALDLRRRLEALGENGCEETDGRDCARGGGTGSSCSPSNAAACGPWATPSGGGGSPNGSTGSGNAFRARTEVPGAGR